MKSRYTQPFSALIDKRIFPQPTTAHSDITAPEDWSLSGS
jgi:hypothetical protein